MSLRKAENCVTFVLDGRIDTPLPRRSSKNSLTKR